MPEVYSPVLAGNWVTKSPGSYALPGPDFVKNKRVIGDPRDRDHPGVIFMPGWVAVRKIGFINLAEAAGTDYDVIVPSPDTRRSDKPRADIRGLYVPAGARLYRLGLRVPPINEQPGYYSSGYRGVTPDAVLASGLEGAAGVGLALGSAPPSAAAAGALTATAASTSTAIAAGPTQNKLRAGADKSVPAGTSLTQLALGAGILTTAEMTIKLFCVDATGAALAAPADAIMSTFLGGINVVAEVCYYVQEEVAGLSDTMLPGAQYSGYGG